MNVINPGIEAMGHKQTRLDRPLAVLAVIGLWWRGGRRNNGIADTLEEAKAVWLYAFQGRHQNGREVMNDRLMGICESVAELPVNTGATEFPPRDPDDD